MKLFRTFSVTLASAAALSLACSSCNGDGGSGGTGGVGGEGGSGATIDSLVCDEGKGLCFTGNGYAQRCFDDSGNCFWYVSNDGICFSDEGDIQLCSPANNDRISPANGELVSCGKCGDPAAVAACTEEALALCDELFTGSQLPSCNECSDPPTEGMDANLWKRTVADRNRDKSD